MAPACLNPSGRYPLRVAVSQNGVNWNVAIDNLDPDPSGDSMDYPAIIQTSDKMLHLTYSWSGKKKIKHVVLNPYILLSEPPCVPTSCADFDGDAFVDTLDLGEISASWLSESLGELTDLNCDRKTDFSDFSLLAANWLQGCP